VISFTVYGEAEPAGSKTAGVTNYGRRFVRDANPASYEWKRLVSQVAGAQMNGAEQLEGPLSLVLTFVRTRPKRHFGKRGLLPSAPAYPTVKPDALKLARAVEDALSGVVYRDDAQVVEQVARKVYGEPARVEIAVREIEAEDAA
jgi:Holliday junction resolvase RusA-like endonuclease